MWKDYSKSYIKNNRAASISVMAAVLIATLFLSLLCSLFFNIWAYDVERVKLREGDWHGRITGDLSKKDLTVIRQFANVEKALVHPELSEEKVIVDVYFLNVRAIYKDMPLIADKLKLSKDAVQYHSTLLSSYLINDPHDKEPPLLLPFSFAVLLVVSISLILIIRNSFEISMNARIHQFGILTSIGATPRQIRTGLLQEAAVLSAIPILTGTALGVLFSYMVIEAANYFAADVAGRQPVIFQCHPGVFAVTFLAAVLTVLFSAWLPAKKLSKLTPLEAIRNTGDLEFRARKRYRLLARVFGIEGELAGNALRMQKKSLRIASLSLLLSFLGFTVMLCFFTLSDISTRYTYFERFQNAWDIMVTVKNTELTDFTLMEEVKQIPDVQSSIVYQKAEADSLIAKDQLSNEVTALGGLDKITETSIYSKGGDYTIASPIIIMDDMSFLEYCLQINAKPSLNGTIIFNKIWDSVNSNFRKPEYIPFLKEDRETLSLNLTEQTVVELPILSYAKEVPVLREEYETYALIQFMPLSMWKSIAGEISGTKPTTYIRIMGKGELALNELNELEAAVNRMLVPSFEIESENRIQEKKSNDELIKGFIFILGTFCGLLAIIGIANVFSNTLGFLRQRKREFAQYQSIGLTPVNIRKMFCIEAIVIAGRPIVITLPLTMAIVAFMISASHLDPVIFMKEAPVAPILIFALLIIAFVGLAYYIGGNRILECDLNETLKNDTMC